MLGLFAPKLYLQNKINEVLKVANSAEYHASKASENASVAAVIAASARDYASNAENNMENIQSHRSILGTI